MSIASPVRSRALWEAGLEPEVSFWRRWIASRGLEWPDEFARRLDPSCPFPDALRALASTPAGGTVRVLDVGAGPMSSLGVRWESRTVELTPIDPLADVFDAALADAVVSPRVRTVRGEAERLGTMFATGAFDLVVATNALDQTYDPMTAIDAMLRATAPGGALRLEHRADGGEHEGYAGLRQWNLRAEAGRFIVWRPGERHDVGEVMGSAARVEAVQSAGWLSVTLRHA